MQMIDFDELLHCLVDYAAETSFNGHVDDSRFDVILRHPFKALRHGPHNKHTDGPF